MLFLGNILNLIRNCQRNHDRLLQHAFLTNQLIKGLITQVEIFLRIN